MQAEGWLSARNGGAAGLGGISLMLWYHCMRVVFAGCLVRFSLSVLWDLLL